MSKKKEKASYTNQEWAYIYHCGYSTHGRYTLAEYLEACDRYKRMSNKERGKRDHVGK